MSYFLTSTYYFDGSDAAASDSNAVWTDETNLDDGNTATFASTNTNGSTSSNYVIVEGTNASLLENIIKEVKARIYGYFSGGSGEVDATIYTDALGESLGACNATGVSPGAYGSYVTLSTPSGGWTWEKIQALETKIYKVGTATTVFASLVEVYVTYEPINLSSKSFYLKQGFQ